ncbi:hypothetical protein FKL27_24395 [Klebsiella pneumoniae]|uniref:hypothetical protein n=1 Tax=Klebsiella TaxID=570 RepID=UPI0007424AC5|nr:MULTISPECIES: hypothetical protein [Klebsiella]HCM3840038.1 hypothetical protein [Klebsiella quasipneumoniae]EIW8602370.1 hypothetical protein [Klebsiella pneumoniae]EIX9458939.1 hypothetical protein [Klebsiella pneumoniae]EKW8334318.1 hypothetical protein [Klebsiella pneumoniae]EKZ9876599.1 hypothetical protein [Klebsiella pneumoniae]
MIKFLSKYLGWLIGLVLAILAALTFGKIISWLGISNDWIISLVGTTIGMISSFLYRNTIKYIKSEEYRQVVNEYKEKRNHLVKKEREELKRKTIVELYLLNEKKTFLKVKLLSIIMIFLGVTLTYFFEYSYIVTVTGTISFALLELKERVLAYRIAKGFYGNNSTEAIQLLKFIEANIDKIDDGSGGGKRKILNDPVLEETQNESLGKGALDAR